MVDPRFKMFRYISSIVTFVVMLLAAGFIPALFFSLIIWSTTQPWILRRVLPAKWYELDGSPKLWVTELAAPGLMVVIAFLLLVAGFVFLPIITVVTAVVDVCRDSIPVRHVEEKVRSKAASSETSGDDGPVEDAEFTEKQYTASEDQSQGSE